MSFDSSSQARKIVELAETRMLASDEHEKRDASNALANEWVNLNESQRNATWNSLKKLYADSTLLDAALSPNLNDALRRYFSLTPRALKDGVGNVTGVEFKNGIAADLRLFGAVEHDRSVQVSGGLRSDGTGSASVSTFAHTDRWGNRVYNAESDARR